MARTESNMLPLGTIAPDFCLPDTLSDQQYSLQELKSEKGTVIMFLCNHCPYVLYLNEALVALVKTYQAQGIAFIGISSNDVERYPQDGPDQMKIHAQAVGYTFPYLYDASQAVAKAYDAACTPDFYLFDGNLSLVYRGQFDSARPGNDKPITGEDLRAALDALLQGQAISPIQRPSMGCNIKWLP